MPIKIGTENISDQQRMYLQEISQAPEEIKLRFLYEVFTDSDILSGREMLHPGWADLYQVYRERLLAIASPDAIKKIESAFAELGQDKEIAAVDPNSARLTFLLGAGASKPTPSDIPTVKELLPDLLTRARRLDRPDLQKLADFCENSRIDNIEDLMTATQLSEFCSRNPSVLKLVDFLIYRRSPEPEESIYRRPRGTTATADLSAVAFLQDTLQMLFGLLSSRMLPAQPNAGHSAIAKYVRNKPDSAIVTTNYDCCMDLALQANEAGFSYLVEFAHRKAEQDHAANAVSLIKLHGSLNWFYCGTCQQVHLIDIAKTVDEYMRDENCYSVIAVCKDCGGQRRGLLVPPLAMKFDAAPPLTPLIEKAQDSFNKADIIVVVGFSFADADMYISRMLTKSLQRNQNVRVVVFDPDFNVVNKLRRQLTLRIPYFEPKRVIRVSGDCSKTLPDFLDGKFRGTGVAEGKAGRAKRKAENVIEARE